MLLLIVAGALPGSGWLQRRLLCRGYTFVLQPSFYIYIPLFFNGDFFIVLLLSDLQNPSILLKIFKICL